MNQSIPAGQTPRLRRLKVYERTLLYGSGGSFNYRVVCNPEIRLCGQWLNQMGFTIGSSIQVLHEHGRIVITVENDDAPL